MKDEYQLAYEHALANDEEYLLAKYNYENYRASYNQAYFDVNRLKYLEMRYDYELKRIKRQFQNPIPIKNIWGKI